METFIEIGRSQQTGELWSYLQGMETSTSLGRKFDVNLNCFDPTYKGWKPTSLSGTKICGWSALILPTRDGNAVECAIAILLGSALILPTRDGNPVTAYYNGQGLCFALILPTRDGNGVMNLDNLYSTVLWSYLQGMETSLLFLLVICLMVLWSYLQGMETNFWIIFFRIKVPLWSYLQGMETPLENFFTFFDFVALILPTRDGNRKLNPRWWRPAILALILPTRDGNCF